MWFLWPTTSLFWWPPSCRQLLSAKKLHLGLVQTKSGVAAISARMCRGVGGHNWDSIIIWFHLYIAQFPCSFVLFPLLLLFNKLIVYLLYVCSITSVFAFVPCTSPACSKFYLFAFWISLFTWTFLRPLVIRIAPPVSDPPPAKFMKVTLLLYFLLSRALCLGPFLLKKQNSTCLISSLCLTLTPNVSYQPMLIRKSSFITTVVAGYNHSGAAWGDGCVLWSIKACELF